MILRQLSFCTFLLETKAASILVDPSDPSHFRDNLDILVYSSSVSSHLCTGLESNTGLLTISGAGEFESHGIFVFGKKNYGHDSYLYKVYCEEISLGYIPFVVENGTGYLDLFEDVDILLVGAGGGPFLPPQKAAEVVGKLSPSIAIFFGFDEQLLNQRGDFSLVNLEKIKTQVHQLIPSKNPLKVEKEFLGGSQGTVNYYFEM